MIDYKSFLSVDNGKGILLYRDEIDILSRNGFNYMDYSNLQDLMFDIDDYINSCDSDIDELEDILLRLGEVNYYRDIKK